MSTNAPGIIKRTNAYFIDPKVIKRREDWNPRFDFGEMTELAKSIKANGILNPIRVKRDGEGFELIDGDRRLTAVEYLLSEGHTFEDGIPAIIEDRKSGDLENLIKMFEANSGKAFLPLEEAAAYQRMKAAGMTYEEIGARVSRNHVHIVDTMRLLTADEEVLDALKSKRIGATTAKAIAKTSKGNQKALVEKAAATPKGGRRKLNKEIEAARVNKKATTKAKVYALDKEDLQELEKNMSILLAEKFLAADVKAPQLAKRIKESDEAVMVATYGILLGLRAALGQKVNLDL